jgi:hypothetical protein
MRKSLRTASLLLAAAAIAGACTTSRGPETRRFDLLGAPERPELLVAPEILERRSARLGRSVRLEDLGVLPADTGTPPRPAPDGSAVAVQRPPTPSWSMLLGRTNAMPSPPPGVAIHRLESSPDGTERFDSGRLAPEPLLLGRGASATGVLVEAPRPDGSRWIGRLRWRDGGVDWLVADEGVNTFPNEANDGSLAWRHRPASGPRGVLRLRSPDGTLREWEEEEDHEWMLPAFSGDGRHLMALLQGDGRAELIAWERDDLEGEAFARPLSQRVDAERSYRAIVAAAVPATEAAGGGWWFVHPDAGRLACWEPGQPRLELLPPGSFAWAGPIADGLVMADREGLWFARADGDEADGAYHLLLDGGWIPCLVGGDAPALLLFGVVEGGFRAVRVRFVDPTERGAAER